MAKSSTFSVSDRVSAATYGAGTITRLDEKYTTIEFDDGATRKFLTTVVQLERSETSAPVKPERPKSTKKSKQAKA